MFVSHGLKDKQRKQICGNRVNEKNQQNDQFVILNLHVITCLNQRLKLKHKIVVKCEEYWKKNHYCGI